MRILMATCTPGRREGGASAVAMELAHQLELLGHSVTILFKEDIPPSKFLPRRLNELHFAAGVAKHIFSNRNKYDVVHLRAPNGCLYGLVRRMFRIKNSPPYVAELDGLEERRAYVIREERRKGSGWDSQLRNRLWHRAYHLPRFRFSVTTADAVVCATREIWSYLQLVYGIRADRVTYLPHAVDSRFFRPREFSALNSLKLLYVGTWLKQRGTKYIIEAFSELTRRLPGIRLTIAGCVLSSEEILSQFQVPARASVEVIPLIPSDQMPDLYAAHDIFVFPSFFEALPLVLLESMASGMPVVTAETCGMMDAVRDDWNGILVPPGNSAAIVNAVMRLKASPELRKRLGTKARETARWFSWDRMAGILEGVLKQAIGESKRGETLSASAAFTAGNQTSSHIEPYNER